MCDRVKCAGRSLALTGALLFAFGAVRAAPAQSEAEVSIAHAAAVLPSVVLPQQPSVFAVAAARMVNPNEVKGAVGEALARDAALLRLGAGNYKSVSARTSRQGIDALLMETDASGRTTGRVVAVEAKWGHREPKLKQTKDGLQGSRTWVRPRLQDEAAVYAGFGQATRVEAGVSASPPKNAVQVELPDGTTGWFSRNGKSYESSFPPERVAEVQELANEYAHRLAAAAKSGAFDSKTIWVEPTGDSYTVHLYEVDPELKTGKDIKISRHKKLASIRLPARGAAITTAFIDSTATEILRKNPSIRSADARHLAKQALDAGNAFHETVAMQRMQQFRALGTMVAMGAAVPLAFGVASGLVDLVEGGEVDWPAVAEVTGVGVASEIAGVGVGVLVSSAIIETPVLAAWASRYGGVARIPPLGTVGLIGGAAGGVVSNVVFAYALAYGGYIDMNQAHREAVIGVVGATAGAGAVTAAMALVGTFGTASTGTAISALSGASATSAITAWFGGGSAAAGGLGATVGGVVLTGGAVIVMIVVGVAASNAWDWFESVAEGEHRLRLLKSLERDCEHDYLREFPGWYRARVLNGLIVPR